MLGQKVRGLRKSHKLTVAALAEKLGISESYLSQLESGRVDPSISLVGRLSAALDVPISAFFDTEYEEPVVIRAADRKTDTSKDESVIVSHLSPDDESAMIQMSEFTLMPGGSLEQEAGSHHICIFLTQGSLRVHFQNQDACLQEEDSICLSTGTQASLINESQEICSGFLCFRCDKKEEKR